MSKYFFFIIPLTLCASTSYAILDKPTCTLYAKHKMYSNEIYGFGAPLREKFERIEQEFYHKKAEWHGEYNSLIWISKRYLPFIEDIEYFKNKIAEKEALLEKLEDELQTLDDQLCQINKEWEMKMKAWHRQMTQPIPGFEY